jgi:hypothetical protein
VRHWPCPAAGHVCASGRTSCMHISHLLHAHLPPLACTSPIFAMHISHLLHAHFPSLPCSLLLNVASSCDAHCSFATPLRRGRSTIMTTRGCTVLFHALCRFVSSNTRGLLISHFLHENQTESNQVMRPESPISACIFAREFLAFESPPPRVGNRLLALSTGCGSDRMSGRHKGGRGAGDRMRMGSMAAASG